MRLLITAYDYRPMLGGIATYVSETCDALSKIPGVEIRLLARDLPGSQSFDQGKKFNTRRVKLSGRSEVAAFQLIHFLKQETQEFKPHAILNFLWIPEACASYFSKSKIPYFTVMLGVEVLESHSTLRKRVRSLLAPLKKRVFQKSKRILAISRYSKALVEKVCNIDPENVGLILAGVNENEFTPGPKPTYLIDRYQVQGKKVFITMTRLVDYKGIDQVIAAMKEVLIEFPNTIYLVCGEGEDRIRLESLIEQYQVGHAVRLVGKIAHTELVDHYRLSDAFVMMSRDDYVTPNVEGFGLVYLEANACERVTLGGRAGGVPDAIQEGVTGWLADPENSADIAQKMKEILKNESRALEMGRAGRSRILKEFTWTHLAQRILNEIENGGVNVRN